MLIFICFYYILFSFQKAAGNFVDGVTAVTDEMAASKFNRRALGEQEYDEI
jgi:hypothetical protein